MRNFNRYKKNGFFRLGLMVLATFSLSGCNVIKPDLPKPPSPGEGGDGEETTLPKFEITPAIEVKDGLIKKQLDFDIRDVHKSGNLMNLKSVGKSKMLIIPVEFEDSNFDEEKKSKIITQIDKCFFGDPQKDKEVYWESVKSYYEKSSYGKLSLTGEVADTWYSYGHSSSYFSTLIEQHKDEPNYDPTWDVLNGAVEWYKETYNTSLEEYDSDKDGVIDGVWLVYGLPNKNYVSYPSDIFSKFWAYSYFEFNNIQNVLTEDKDSDKYIKSPVAYNYCWASYDFMYQAFNNKKQNIVDAHTYIHETGHLMGLPDYYVTSECPDMKYNGKEVKNLGPSGVLDMMDGNIGDHNAYSKMQYGWISPYIAYGNKSFDITLKSTTDTGEVLLLPTEVGSNLTQFDEYIMIEYLTNNESSVNYRDSTHIYPNNKKWFSDKGIRVSHIDSRLGKIPYSSNQGDESSPKHEISFTDELEYSYQYYTNNIYANTQVSNYLHEPYREFQVIDKIGRNFDFGDKYGNRISADDDTLFYENDEFSFEKYKSQFPQYYYNNKKLMNNGSRLPYSFKVDKLTDKEAHLSITYHGIEDTVETKR